MWIGNKFSIIVEAWLSSNSTYTTQRNKRKYCFHPCFLAVASAVARTLHKFRCRKTTTLNILGLSAILYKCFICVGFNDRSQNESLVRRKRGADDWRDRRSTYTARTLACWEAVQTLGTRASAPWQASATRPDSDPATTTFPASPGAPRDPSSRHGTLPATPCFSPGHREPGTGSLRPRRSPPFPSSPPADCSVPSTWPSSRSPCTRSRPSPDRPSRCCTNVTQQYTVFY